LKNPLFAAIVPTVINYKHKLERFPMQILVTNDDGILAEGLWTLVRELQKIARVTVVAPDRERSAIGTAVTLRQPLRVRRVKPMVPGVEACSVDGTPSDSVILALGKLAEGRVDIVVSGINHGSNLGEDVHISGTVGAALQGYLRGVSAIAVSVPRDSESHLDTAAGVVAALVKRLGSTPLTGKIFLNINLPDLTLNKIAGTKVTRLARESHINTVEEGSHGRQQYYWLERERVRETLDGGTDIWAIEHGYISITPLYLHYADKPPSPVLEGLCSGLLPE
jgi:5'-nucleotidase